MGIVELETQFIGLLVIAVMVAIGARRWRVVPYETALVLTGLAVGLLQIGQNLDIHLEPDLILLTFLPGLLFEAAYHLDTRALRENIRIVGFLAIPGVLLAMSIIGVLLHVIAGLPLVEGLLFGVLISATDPIAVLAMFKRLGVDKRLSTIVEGESLFNDGTAIVLFTILRDVAAGEATFNLNEGITSLAVSVTGAIILGRLAGWVFGRFMARIDDHIIDLALTLILAYGTYLLAEEITILGTHLSPVIAVVIAGNYVGNYKTRDKYSPTSTVTIVTFWEFITFLINSAIFLLIGLEIKLDSLIADMSMVVLGIGVVLAARALVIYTLGYIVRNTDGGISLRWVHVLFWGGLRGAVSIALALSLPAIQSQETLRNMAFGYVLFSLVAQALTIKPLLKRLNIINVHPKRRDYERHRARAVTTHAAMNAIRNMRDRDMLPEPLCRSMQEDLRAKRDHQWQQMSEIIRENPALITDDVRFVRRDIAHAQKKALLELLRLDAIGEEVYTELSDELNEIIEQTHREDWDIHTLAEGDPSPLLPDQESEA